MLISGNPPWLLSEDGSRYVGVTNPDGTESQFVFADTSKQASTPAPKPAEQPQPAEQGSAPGHSGGAHHSVLEKLGIHGKSEVQ